MIPTTPSTALAVAALLAFAGPSFAQEPKLDCSNATATPDLVACAGRELDVADKALNAAYHKAIAAIRTHAGTPPHDAKAYEAAFRAAQRAWVAYRDADCRGVIPFAWTGGQGGETEVLGCLTEKTRARTRDLLDRYSGP